MKYTPQVRAGHEEVAAAAIREVCRNAGEDIADYLRAELRKLTDDELHALRGMCIGKSNGFYRVARVMLCALGPERIDQQWQADSTIKDTKRVRRWLRNRP